MECIIIPSSNKQPFYYLKATWLYKKKKKKKKEEEEEGSEDFAYRCTIGMTVNNYRLDGICYVKSSPKKCMSLAEHSDGRGRWISMS